MQASVPIGGAVKLLQDAANIRWSAADLLFWFNEAQRQIVQVRPDAKTTRGNIALAAGIDQAIPATGLRLIRVTRNATGRVVSLVSEEQLSDFDPSWPSAGQSTTVKHYMHDPLEPKAFQVYPPATAGTQVQAVWSVMPTDAAADTDAIDIDPIWEPAIVDYILYRAYARNADDGNAGRAALHRDSFMLALTGKTQADAATNPGASQPNKVRPNAR